MQEDFHYYATYCAALLAGYSHENSLQVGYASQFADCCTETFLAGVNGPRSASTTQLQSEMMNTPMDPVGLQKITRIWSAFHFLPRDLSAPCPGRPKWYRDKYRLICGPDGPLVKETVELAMCRPLPAVGLAMHVLADTWAHTYFAGTPSLVINNTMDHFYELAEGEDGSAERRKVAFNHNPAAKDDPDTSHYTNTVCQEREKAIMNLGHGRAGHLPDYSFVRYEYLPAWGDYEAIVKDNPSDYYHAFCQMVYAMEYYRGRRDSFELGLYAEDTVAPWKDEIMAILKKRQLNACADWKAFGEKLSGREIEDFSVSKYQDEYISAAEDKKDRTFLGRYFLAALTQKSMVTKQIFSSGNLLAGFSVDYRDTGFRGIRDFQELVNAVRKEAGDG